MMSYAGKQHQYSLCCAKPQETGEKAALQIRFCPISAGRNPSTVGRNRAFLWINGRFKRKNTPVGMNLQGCFFDTRYSPVFVRQMIDQPSTNSTVSPRWTRLSFVQRARFPILLHFHNGVQAGRSVLLRKCRMPRFRAGIFPNDYAWKLNSGFYRLFGKQGIVAVLIFFFVITWWLEVRKLG